jgi:DNA-binding NarL/FixJ family response regulator
MPFTQSDILLLAKQPHVVRVLSSLLKHSHYTVASTSQEEQALAQIDRKPPFLIILAGDTQHWSQPLLRKLRHAANVHRITLVALTDFHTPRWMHQNEAPGFDGFLVYPLGGEVLSSLVESAHARQALSLAM